MFANLIVLPLRLSAVIGLLAACFAVDIFRRMRSPASRRSIERKANVRGSARPPSLPRRLAYLGVLSISLIACTFIALGKLGRV